MHSGRCAVGPVALHFGETSVQVPTRIKQADSIRAGGAALESGDQSRRPAGAQLGDGLASAAPDPAGFINTAGPARKSAAGKRQEVRRIDPGRRRPPMSQHAQRAGRLSIALFTLPFIAQYSPFVSSTHSLTLIYPM